MSSDDAGVILPTLRMYGVRLAVVQRPDSTVASSRFGEVVAEERSRRDFGVCASRATAHRWLVA